MSNVLCFCIECFPFVPIENDRIFPTSLIDRFAKIAARYDVAHILKSVGVFSILCVCYLL